ncbi:MAG: IS982 family transposase [Bacteroidales bacterium]|nr:IS982 family transposase [Bacteroidales bacterium]
MNTQQTNLIEIFYIIDEFCKNFDKTVNEHSLSSDTTKKTRNKKSKMSTSEVITILVLFHTGGYRNLKHFYLFYVGKHLTSEFPNQVSYNRFVELQQKSLFPMVLFLKTCCMAECTGISFIDSTKIAVCNHKRISRNKVFEGIATIGKSTMGWFFGFKLHLVINDKGELLNFVITQANVDDRMPLENNSFTKNVFGKLFADKGYISKSLFEMLFVDGIQLVTQLKKNMKGAVMSQVDSILLRKRSVIETINDELKNICQIEHTRHRSFGNFIANLISGLIAYSFFPKKPSIKVEFEEKSDQLALFY